MEIRDRRGLKQHAAQSLAAASYSPYKLVLLHTGVALMLSLLLTAVSFYLTRQIDSTGGLAGLGIRSVLSTTRSLLEIAGTVVLTFWEFGILYAALRLTRNQPAAPNSLTAGFRRFWPLMRLQILRGLILLGVTLACVYAASFIFAMTPLSNAMRDILNPLIANTATADLAAILDQVTLSALTPTMWPLFVIMGLLICAFVIPVFYRFRMAEYSMLDSESVGAIASLRISRQLMRGNRIALARLDLSFWWFYLLQALVLAVSYGDVLLSWLKISLPISTDVAFFVFYLLHIACQLILYWRFRVKIETTYAAAFDALRQPPADHPPLPQSQT